MVFLTLLVIPLLIALGFFLFSSREVTSREFIIHVGIQLLVAGTSIAIIYYSNIMDTEILNGQVTSKNWEKVSCRHSYSCNCRQVCSGSGSDESCSTVCDTCYEHSYDIDWEVKSNIATWSIDTIDRQGLKEPPRWNLVQVGDPVVAKHVYLNYIKGSPDTLFRFSGEGTEYRKYAIPYSQDVYDYYKIDRVVTINYLLADKDTWNRELSVLNGHLGYQKQCNILIVLTSLPREFFYTLAHHWLGGKKNDIIVVIGAKDLDIQWANILTWTDNSIFKVSLIGDILDLKTVDRQRILSIIEENTKKYFIRKPMSDFKYLQASVTPTTLEWSIAMILGMLISIGVGIFFRRNN